MLYMTATTITNMTKHNKYYSYSYNIYVTEKRV